METKYVTRGTLERNIKSGHWRLVQGQLDGSDGRAIIIELTKTVQVKTKTRYAGDRYYINTSLFSKK